MEFIICQVPQCPQKKAGLPGQCPKKLIRAKHLRNQVYIAEQQSKALFDQAMIILQQKWRLDESIRLMKVEQETITREYFYENGLVKTSKADDSLPQTSHEELEAKYGFSVQDALAALSARRDSTNEPTNL